MSNINQLSQQDYLTVKEIFLHAIKKPPQEVVEFLQSQCKDQQQLYPILTSLIETHRYSETLTPKTPFGDILDNQQNIVDGDTIGKFTIEKLIGCGGMGDVYLANRNEDIQQKVAIKVLKNKLNQQALKRFHLEKKLLAQLEHPGIARLIDSGVENGLTYYVMEYVNGVAIDQYCHNKKLSVKQRLKLFKKVCNVVSYAHNSFIIHRDLKPQNILITKKGHVKLLDFGIAKPLHQYCTNEQLTDTTQGLCAFTPQYAAPEQFNNGLIGAACDVYALGLLLFELLTSIEAQNVKGLSLLQIQQLIIHHIPANASQQVLDNDVAVNSFGLKTVQQLNRRLRGDLDAIIHHAIKKEPHKRYQSVKDLVADIDRHLNYQPITVRNNLFAYRLIKFLQRRWFPIVSVNSIIIIALFSVFFIVKERNKAINEHELSEQMANLITTTFKNVSHKMQQESTAKNILDEGLKQIKNQKNKKVRDRLLLTMSHIYFDLADYPTALDLLQNSSIKTHESIVLKSRIYHHLNRPKLALQTLNQIDHQHTPLSELSCLSVKSQILKNVDLSKARVVAQKMLNKAQLIYGENSLKYADYLIQYGHGFADTTDTDTNIKHYQKIIKIFSQHRLTQDQRLISTYDHLAQAFSRKGLSNVLLNGRFEVTDSTVIKNIKPPIMLSTINQRSQQSHLIPLQFTYQNNKHSLITKQQKKTTLQKIE